MQDWNYGHFYYILYPIDRNSEIEQLKDLYNEILADIYYSFFSSIVIIIVCVIYVKNKVN